MKSVLEQAYADAVKLASTAADIDKDSFAFTHYFGGEKTDLQHEHFKKMMSAISSDTQYYNIQMECSGTVEACKDLELQFVAATEASAGGPDDQKIINICPNFWTSASTKYLLYDSEKTNPNPPYRDNTATRKGWCGTTQGISTRKHQFYATAGHSILHELTHLDSLAKQAGLTAPGTGRDKGAHGTDDAQKGCELEGARAYLKKYKDDSKQTSPDYNAESYAAAATELYFMKLCNFPEIRPKAPKSDSAPPPPPANGIPAPKCAGTPTGTGEVAFSQADADAAITTFCSNRDYWGKVLTPAVSFGTGQTNDGRGKVLGMSDPFKVNGGADNLWLGLSFAEDECQGMFQFDQGTNDDEKLAHCVDRFRTVLNGCNTEGLFPKYGGELREVCAVYRMTGRRADQTDPLALKSSGDLGAFTCENTNTTGLPPSSPLVNTCACWYANVPGPTDVFKKPASGNCAETDKTELLIN